MTISNKHNNFGKVWTCGSLDMHVDRQTNRHTHHNIPHTYWEGVIK